MSEAPEFEIEYVLKHGVTVRQVQRATDVQALIHRVVEQTSLLGNRQHDYFTVPGSDGFTEVIFKATVVQFRVRELKVTESRVTEYTSS